MNNIQIALDQNFEGFAEGNFEMLQALHKALSAGSGVDAASFTGGRALIPESLDTTLVNVLWTQDEARFFKKLKKKPIKSPVHQWNKRTGVGSTDGAWVAEGGNSQEADQNIARAYITAKYLQTLRKVTLQATISNMIEDAVSSEKIAGTLWIIQQIEKALFYSDSSVVAEEPDGLIKIIPAANTIDLRGAAASASAFEDAIGEGARIIRGNYGVATDLFTSLMVMEDVQKLLRDRIRFGPGKEEGSTIFTQYPTPFGKPELTDDIFILEGAVPSASTLTSDRPSQVSIVLTRQAATSGTSQFAAGDAGSYWYQVSAVNKYGQAQASAAVQVTGVITGDEVKIDITDGATAGTGYYVFRSKKDAADGSDCRFMYKIARSGANPTIYDLNADLPGTSSSFLLNLNGAYNAIEWAQFLPMMKFDLYPTNAAVIPFLMLLFGALAVKKEEQMIRIKNISPSGLGWF